MVVHALAVRCEDCQQIARPFRLELSYRTKTEQDSSSIVIGKQGGNEHGVTRREVVPSDQKIEGKGNPEG